MQELKKDYKALQNGSDIRGVALKVDGGKDVNLTRQALRDLSYVFVDWLCTKVSKRAEDLRIAVGRDSRITGIDFEEEIANALVKKGVTVLKSGLSTTPAMFMATILPKLHADGSIMITASHLPYERNGLKFFTREGGLDKDDIAGLIKKAEELLIEPNKEGSIEEVDLMDEYAEHLRKVICRALEAKEEDMPLLGLHVVVDAGNGASGFYVSNVLKRLGANCRGSQFLDPDGMFPNHEPNPENKEAMESICKAVKENGADLGIIFDTDGDRASAVDENAKEISRNRIVALAAILASEGHVKTTVVTDSITSTHLTDFLQNELGLEHFRFKRGYKNVINKGLELNRQGTDCQLAIETSGHAALKENYFLDDGAYLATKIVIKAAQLKKQDKGISSLLAKLKEPAESEEFRFKIEDEDFAGYAETVLNNLEERIKRGDFKGMSVVSPNFEGLRVDIDYNHGDGWFLLRKSLHDPVMPLNVESNDVGGVKRIMDQLEPFFKKYKKLER